MNDQTSFLAEPEEITRQVSAEFLAECFGVSRPTISKFKDKGMPKAAYGKFDLKDCIQWYISYMSERVDGGDSDDDATKKQRLALLEAQTEKTELENQKLRGELISFEMHKTILNALSSQFAASLEGMGPRFSNQFAAMTNAAEIQQELIESARSIRSGLATSIRTVAGDGIADHSIRDSGTAAASNG